jgi:protein-S-isoprenylcysteine O-methyltransferase Ste14
MQGDPSRKAIASLILFGAAAFAFVLDRAWPVEFMPRGAASVIAILLILAVLAFLLWVIRDFPIPTTEIVTSGAFQFNRNPTCLGVIALSLGIAFTKNSLWFLAFCALAAIDY